MRRCVLIAMSLMQAMLFAQKVETFDVAALEEDGRWKRGGETKLSLSEIQGKKAVRIEGLVWLDGFEFSNGVIDVDLLGRSQPVQGSFLGVAFRVMDEKAHDLVYFRPFNFQAVDAGRRSHAVQYTSHPVWTWQKLRAERTDRFEKAVRPEVNGDEWFHARIVVERPKVSVFVNGAKEPCLVVEELSDRAGGAVGLWAGQFGYFANLRIAKGR